MSTSCPEHRAHPATEAHQLLTRLFLPIGITDPYPAYRALRALSRSIQSPFPGSPLIVTQHDDCVTVLRGKQFDVDSDLFIRMGHGYWSPDFRPTFSRSLLLMRGADHARYRRVVTRTLGRPRVDAMRPYLEGLADQTLDAMERSPDEPVNLIAAVALPFAARAVAPLFGLDAAAAVRVARLVRPLSSSLEFATRGQRRVIEHADTAGSAIFSELLNTREVPDDCKNLIGGSLAHFGPHGRDEAVANILFLFAAAFDSTASAIGLSTLALLNNPDQAHLMRTEPDLAESAVEELLRFESPVQMLQRMTTSAATVADSHTPVGVPLLLLTGAANRDAARYTDPDELRLARPIQSTLTFGAGSHYCPGAYVARAELQILLRRLLERFPRMRMAGRPTFRTPGTVFRGIERLPVLRRG